MLSSFFKASKDPPPGDGSLTRGDVDSYNAALLMHLTLEVQEGQRKLAEQRSALEEKDIRIAYQECHIDKLREAGQSFRQDNAKMTCEIVELKALIQELQRPNNIMRSHQKIAVEGKEKLEAELQDLKAKDDASQQDREDREKQFKLLVLEKERLEVDFGKVKGQADDLKQQNRTLKLEVDQLRVCIESLELEGKIKDAFKVQTCQVPPGGGSSSSASLPRDQDVAELNGCVTAHGARGLESGPLSLASPVQADSGATFCALAAEHDSTLQTLSALQEEHRTLQAAHDSELQAHADLKERYRQLEESERTWRDLAEEFRRKLDITALGDGGSSCASLPTSPLNREPRLSVQGRCVNAGGDAELASSINQRLSKAQSARQAFEQKSRGDGEEPTEELRKVEEAKKRYEARKALARQRELTNTEEEAQEYEVVTPADNHRVRDVPDVNGKEIALKPKGAIVVGVADKGWLKLRNEPGYMLMVKDGMVFLKMRTSKQDQGACALPYLQAKDKDVGQAPESLHECEYPSP